MPNAFDTSNAPTREPTEIIAGNFIAWRRTDLSTDYPPADYILTYECRSEGTPSRLITFTATDADGDYLVQVLSGVSKEYLVANYHWSAYITRNSDSERVEIDSGYFTVTPNRALDSSDPRSLPLKMLGEIEEALLHRATNKQLDVLAYSLGIETSATRDPSKLLEHRTYWQRELVKINRRIAARKGLGHSGMIRTKF